MIKLSWFCIALLRPAYTFAVGYLMSEHLPSRFPDCKLINDFIKINNSHNSQRILRPDSRSCGIVERRSFFFILFNLENDLFPEQLVTIKQKNNLKIVSTFGKAA
jgi:hypothetical protein